MWRPLPTPVGINAPFPISIGISKRLVRALTCNIYTDIVVKTWIARTPTNATTVQTEQTLMMHTLSTTKRHTFDGVHVCERWEWEKERESASELASDLRRKQQIHWNYEHIVRSNKHRQTLCAHKNTVKKKSERKKKKIIKRKKNYNKSKVMIENKNERNS